MPRGTLYLGTSGFAYPEWKGAFYPSDLRADGMLRYYATRFSSVEINYTFQRAPAATTLAKWVADTPDGFGFSLKAHRRITHNARLRDVDEPLKAFLESIAPLGTRLGPVLFQCPPNLRADLALLESFCALLPREGRFAIEFRHESWDIPEVARILETYGIARCTADTDSTDARMEQQAPGFAYLRLRKTEYSPDALTRWASSITETLERETDVYCYLKHEDQGHGVQYAFALSDLVPSGSPARAGVANAPSPSPA